MAESEEVDIEDVIRVLVATDNHLGYGEKDSVRGEDSFVTFEEILELAVVEDVDFILLGGDLFHDPVPSSNTLNTCIKLLRRYTFGDKPIAVEILSDQSVNFHNEVNQSVNYYDPNVNISIPVFSIHGNHDDPSGFGRLSSLDLLSSASLVNYFGRWTDLTQIAINPVLLRKGQTQMALYGLSHIHDSRLVRLFEGCKVSIECPSADENEWFHLMVLHQNRADRGPKNYLPEEVLPEFLHLVIWGHEHDCRIEPEFNSKRNFYVSQPGSSVPTSLSEGEALPKHVGLLEIHKTKFQMKPIPLQTVRPFVFESVDLSNMVEELRLDEGNPWAKVKQMAEDRVKEMIEKSKEQLTGHPKQPTLPLIRLRILFTDEEQMFNAIRFGQAYNEQVANPSDMIHFKKLVRKTKHENQDFDKAALKKSLADMDSTTELRVEDLIDRFFNDSDGKQKLQLMPTNVLSQMCFHLVEKNDANAIDNIIESYKQKAVDHLMETLPDDDDIDEELNRLKNKISSDDVQKFIIGQDLKTTSSSVKGKKTTNEPDFHFDDDSEDEDAPVSKTPTKGRGSRGRGRGRGSRGSRGNANTTTVSNTTTSSRGSRGSRSGRTMPELNVSMNKKGPSLLDCIAEARSTRAKKVPTFVVSDDSD